MLKDVYAAVVNDDDKSLKAVQKLPINTTAERDYSAQETCHLLLQLPMFMSRHRGTSSSFVLALLPCVLASVHVNLVSAFAVLARSLAFSPSPQGFRPLSYLCSAVCAVPMSAVYTSHSFSLSGVHEVSRARLTFSEKLLWAARLYNARTCCKVNGGNFGRAFYRGNFGHSLGNDAQCCALYIAHRPSECRKLPTCPLENNCR